MPLYDYEIGELFTATGTAQANAGDLTQVDGDGTNFNPEFAAGYLITINDETRVVASVTNDTTLVVEVAFSSSVAKAAFTGVNTINLESLTPALNPPKSSFVEFSQLIQLGDGTVRGLGWPSAQWAWGFLTQAQRDELRLFCDDASSNPLASNAVRLRTRTNETDAYAYYSGTLIWPEAEEKMAGKRLEFLLRFVNLVEIEVS